MSGRLSGKSCLVTAAAQGIGRAIADRLHTEGAHVIAADIVADPAKAEHDRYHTIRLDVTDPEQVAQMAVRYPRVDVLVNCVGYVATGTALECSAAELERSFQINMLSVLRMSQAVLPGMIERGNGAIVNIASVVSTTKAASRRFAYAATKGAVLAMTRSIALDFIGDGIRCNSISPGTVETPSLEARIRAMPDMEAARRAMVERQPLGRFGRPDEIAAVAALLASDESPFMTGADIVIDGGMSL